MKINKKEVVSLNYVLELTPDEATVLYDALSCAIDEWQNNIDHCYDFAEEGDLRLIQAIREELVH